VTERNPSNAKRATRSAFRSDSWADQPARSTPRRSLPDIACSQTRIDPTGDAAQQPRTVTHIWQRSLSLLAPNSGTCHRFANRAGTCAGRLAVGERPRVVVTAMPLRGVRFVSRPHFATSGTSHSLATQISNGPFSTEGPIGTVWRTRPAAFSLTRRLATKIGRPWLAPIVPSPRLSPSPKRP
jgi:hypothetical protein